MHSNDIYEIQMACFRLGEDLYAIDIMRIKEIIRPQKLSNLPKAPIFIDGVINLRGMVIPVIDLRKRFDMPERPLDSSTRLLIVKVVGQAMGLVVDDVTEVITVPLKDIKPPPAVAEGGVYDYLLGVCLAKDAMVMLLNLDTLLTPLEVSALERLH
jgi:purine-binding chemotaxis protein CheW